MKTIDADIDDGLMNAYRARDRHVRTVGFVKPDDDICQFLVTYGPWVEIGSGSGALARGIRAAGGRCVATDNFSWHGSSDKRIEFEWGREGIIQADAERVGRLVSRYPNVALLASWPSYNEDWCYRAVRHLKPGQLFGYIGEGAGGCTGDDKLHDLLETDFLEIDFHPVTQMLEGLHDALTIYQRQP